MTISEDNTARELRIAGKLDIDSASSLRDALVNSSGASLREVDLSETDECDTAALQVLLAATGSGKFPVRALSDAVRQTAAALGFHIEEVAHAK